MDIIKYKGGRALLIDSEDIMKMDARDLGVLSPFEAAVRHLIENREVLQINALIIVTSMKYESVPKFLRDIVEEVGFKINCFRAEWFW